MQRIIKIREALDRVMKGAACRHLFVPVKPVPASRPRVAKWGTHYTKTYEGWRKEAGEFLESFWQDQPFTGPVLVITEIVCPKAAKSFRMWPRGDTDNFEKAIWDSLTKAQAIWQDDDQIIANFTSKRYAERGETPGVHITAYHLELPA